MVNKFILVLVFLSTFFGFFSQDSIVCEYCGLKKMKILLNTINKNLNNNKIVLNDFSLSYSQSVVMQYYLDNKTISFDDGTGNMLFSKRAYRIFYSKLRGIDSIYYIGSKIESDFTYAFKVIDYLTDKDSAKTVDEVYIENILRELIYLDYDNVDRPLIEKKMRDLIYFIQVNIESINFFIDKKNVLLICNSIDKSMKNPNSFPNIDKIVLKFE